jgi:hypothetical protein
MDYAFRFPWMRQFAINANTGRKLADLVFQVNATDEERLAIDVGPFAPLNAFNQIIEQF